MLRSYNAWARYDVDAELARVDEREERERVTKAEAEKTIAKRAVEDSVSRTAEQSAEVLAAQAAVAALKAKSRRRHGRVEDAETPEPAEAGLHAAIRLQRQAEVLRRKHELIKDTMDARRRGDVNLEDRDWVQARRCYQSALASAKDLEELVPELLQIEAQSACGKPRSDGCATRDSHVHPEHDQCMSEHHPNHDDCHENHGVSCCHRDRGDAKRQVKSTSIPSLPDKSDLRGITRMFLIDCYVGLGVCALGQGHFAAASEAFKEVLLRDENHLLAWMQRGKTFEKMGSPLLAWLHYNRVTNTDASFVDAKTEEDRMKAVIAAGLDDCVESSMQVDIQARIEASPSNAEILEQLRLVLEEGQVLMVEGFYADAIKKFEIALIFANHGIELCLKEMIGPIDVLERIQQTCHVNIAGCCLEIQRHLSKAQKHCQVVLKADSGHATAHFRLGQTYRALHDYSNALDHLQRARELSQQHPNKVFRDQLQKLEQEIDRCEFERGQYDIAYIRQHMTT